MPTPAPPPPDAARPAALAAFLRGVERRAMVLAELQAGDPVRGDAAVRRAVQALAAAAPALPMAEWPRRFWRTLLADPVLAAPAAARFVPAASPAVRAAVLLRLTAGLEEADAGAVLGVAPARVREALHRALPRDADGRPDAALWRQWQAEVQRRVRDLPAARVAALATPEVPVAAQAPRRAPRRAIAAVAAAVVLALVGTLVFDRVRDRPIRAEPLPPAGEPASRYEAEAGLIAHPDFDRLARTEEARLADDAAYLAWTIGHAATPTEPPSAPARSTDVPPVPGEGTDAP